MRKKFLLMLTVLVIALGGSGKLFAEGVAKVGNTEYATIDEAIANWTNGTTLTLLADVQLSDVIQLSSTEMHTLDLSTFTMTAASKKDAIQIVNNGRSSASYALDIKADATNPGGITATGKTVVVTTGKSGVKDRPIIRFYNGVFNATNIVKHSGSNGTNCPQFQFHGGVFNGNISTNRSLNQFYGGTFNGQLWMSVDSSAYTLIAGGTFKQLSNLYMSALNSDKFTIGSAKGVFDRGVYVDDNGNVVIGGAVVTEAGDKFEASSTNAKGAGNYLEYSSAKNNGLYYTSVKEAFADNNTTSGKVTVYAEEVDMTDISYKGTIVVPEGKDITITNAPSTLKVQLADGTVLTPDANGTVATKLEVATLDELQAALASNITIPIIITAQIEIPADETVVLDLNGNTVNSVFNGTSTTNHIYALSNKGTLTIEDSKGNGSINSRGIYNYGSLTLNAGAINAIDGNGGYAVNNQSGSTFVMNGGVVAATNEDDHQSSSGGYDATALKVPAGCTATLNGGTINNVCDFTYAIDAAGTLNIPETSAITVNGTHGAIAVSGGETTINAGTFQIPADNYSRTDNVLYVSGGSLVVNGGTFIGDSDTAGGGSCLYDAAGKAVVNGGTFKGSSGGDVWGTTGTTIKGGTFENLIEKQHIAAGYELKDGTVVEKKVAEINGVEYATLAAAVAAVNEGETITLIDNVVLAERVTIPADKTLTIDLNGKSISMEESIIATAYAINNLGTLTIKDTKGNGSINARGIYNGYGDGAANVASAKITVLSGTINAKGTNGGAAIFNYGIADIQDGNFTSIGGYSLNNQAGASMTIADGVSVTGGIYNNSNAELTVNGGNISNNRSGCHTIYAWNAKVIVNGGSIHNENSGNATIMSAGTSEVTINGGTISIKDGRVPGNGNTWTSCLTDAANTAKIIVNDGTFNGGVRVQGGATMTINGGSFNDVTGSGYNVYTGATVEVKGGTFTDAAAQTFAKNNIADDYKLGEDGKVVYAPVVAKIGETKYETLDAAFAAATEGQTITLLADATPALTSQRAITKAAVIDLGGKTMTLTEDDLYFGTTTFKNGTIVVDPSVKPSTAVFWMFANQTLTFDAVKVVATGVTGTYLIGLDGNNSDLNLINGSEILVENTTALDLDIICVNASTGNDIKVENSKVNVTNLDGRVFFRGNYTVSGTSEVNLEGITKAGFRIEAGQTLTIADNAIVNIVGEPRDGGIHLTDLSATYTKAETATVNATVNEPKVAKVGENTYRTLAQAVAAVEDGGTITLIANETFTNNNRTLNTGTWYDGLYYVGDKSFTIDLGGFTIGQDGSVNDYLLNFKNSGSKANTITLKNGTVDAGTAAFCALCTSSSQENQLTINTEKLALINNISNGSTVKLRGGAILNVKEGTVITGKNSYLGIECVASTVNIYDGAKIYMNGTTSYNGCLVGACGGGTVNVYGGYGKGVKGGFIAMTSGGTINVEGGEWIANTDGTVGNNSNVYVLTAQSNINEQGFVGPAIINVTGGTFRGGMDAWVLNNHKDEKAELNISGGNFNAKPTSYVVEDYIAVENNGVWNVVKAAAKIDKQGYATIKDAVAAVKESETITILAGTHSEGTIKLPATLKNVTLKGVEGAILKDMTISAADGNSYSYVNLTFDGITFDNSRLLFTGWRNGEETIENLTVTNCTFKNLYDTTNTAPVHINKDASEAVENFTFTNNVIDGATGGSKSGIYAQVTGDVVVENNIINNVSFRPYVIQVTTDDGIADNFTVKGNTFSGSAAGRAQGLGNNAEGTDDVTLVVSNNIFKNITNSQQICYWNFNAEKTTADLSGNYYDIDIVANPGKIYYNAAAANIGDLVIMDIFPIYTALNEDGTIDLNSAFTVNGVSTKAELNAAIASAEEGATIVMIADIDYGTDQLKIEKDITLDLGGKTLTTRNAYGGMSVKNNPTVKNGNIVHASNTAAIKVWNATAFEDLVIDVQGKGDANKTIGGIVLQSGSTTRVGLIKNVTIKGAALTNGIETYNCGDATENVIGAMENVAINAQGTGMLISAPCGTATNCSISGGTNGIEIWIKGTYSASLNLVGSTVEGGVYAHDEFSSNPDIVNNGTLNFTADEATTGADAEDVTLTIARAENVEGVLEEIMNEAQAKVNDTYYLALTDAIAAAQAEDVVTVFEGTYAMPSMKAGITIIGEGDVLFEGTLSGTLENLTMKNIHIKGANAQRWAYAKGNLVFENVTFEATSVYALHFDGITAGTNLTYKNCTIIGWAAMGGSPASCTFEGCTIKGNGTYGVIRTYFNTTIQNCKFDVANVNTTDAYQDGIHAVEGATVTVDGCTNENGDMIDLVNIHALSIVELDGVEIKNVVKTNGNYYRTLAEAFAAVGVGNGKTVELIRDVDLAGAEWTPVNFNGVFDGQDHTISNLVVNGGSNSNQGFFAQTNNGEIKNVTFNNAKVTGRLNVGVVAGTPYTSKYTNVKVTGHVEVNGMAYVGGVGGKNAYANWTDITVDVDATSYVEANSVENGTAYRTYVGGVVGFNGEGGHTFKNISSNIKVIGSTCDIGGIFGIAHYNNKFENITFTGAVEAPAEAEEVGGIAGVWHNEEGTSVTFTNCTSAGKVTIGDVETTGSIVGAAYNPANETEENSGSLIIDGVEAWLKVAQVGEVKYLTLAEAVAAVTENTTITMLADVELTSTVTVAKGQVVTLNLNGKTISAAITEQLTKSFAAICNKGTLTVKDSATTRAAGKITVSYAGNTFGYGVGLYTISNEGGVLNIESGIVENTTTVSGSMYDAIDNNSTLGETVLNITGGEVSCPGYIGVRQFANNSTYENIVNVTGGKVVGGNTSIWMQNPSSGNPKATIAISGDANIDGRLLAGTSTGFTFNVTGGTFTKDPSAYLSAEFDAIETNGTWVVKQVSGTQTREFTRGWNWFSSYVDLSQQGGLGKLQTALGESGLQIKGQNKNQSVVYQHIGNNIYDWIGDLDLTAGKMYMVNTSAAVSAPISGDFVDYENEALLLKSGWNWISYPLNQEVDINTALQNLDATQGDNIKGYGTTSIATYYNGKWVGPLATLNPGQGYMYQSAKQTSFVYSTEGNTANASKSNVSAEETYWTPSMSEYANNMVVFATLRSGEMSDNYEVAAFANGECRGSARPIYIEQLDQYMLFMTIYGDEVEEMTFKCYDVNNGTEYDLINRMVYSNDAVVGSLDEPYIFTCSTTGIGEATLSDINIYPNPTTTDREINLQATCDKVEVFNTLGVKVAEYQNVDTIDALETAGTYVIRVTLNGDVKHCRLVVK